MIVNVSQGNILESAADVLISPANPWLNMSGGINGEILSRCGMDIQNELNAYLDECGLKAVPGATVVPTKSVGLPFKHIVHAVAIDPFEDSSEHLVGRTLVAAFQLADAFGANSVSLPALATGYGPLSHTQFAQAFAKAMHDHYFLVERIFLVLDSEDAQQAVASILDQFDFGAGVEIR